MRVEPAQPNSGKKRKKGMSDNFGPTYKIRVEPAQLDVWKKNEMSRRNPNFWKKMG